MNDFLMLFRNISGDNDYITTPQEMARDMPAWQAWIGNIAMQGKLVSTQPMEWAGTVVTNSGVTNQPGLDQDRVLVAGYLICKSDTMDEVSAWAKTCPILGYRHGSVEVRPLVPFPMG